MFAGNFFANGSLSTKFAKSISRENFLQYGMMQSRDFEDGHGEASVQVLRCSPARRSCGLGAFRVLHASERLQSYDGRRDKC